MGQRGHKVEISLLGRSFALTVSCLKTSRVGTWIWFSVTPLHGELRHCKGVAAQGSVCAGKEHDNEREQSDRKPAPHCAPSHSQSNHGLGSQEVAEWSWPSNNPEDILCWKRSTAGESSGLIVTQYCGKRCFILFFFPVFIFKGFFRVLD